MISIEIRFDMEPFIEDPGHKLEGKSIAQGGGPGQFPPDVYNPLVIFGNDRLSSLLVPEVVDSETIPQFDLRLRRPKKKPRINADILNKIGPKQILDHARGIGTQRLGLIGDVLTYLRDSDIDEASR